jgi:hypothetical protein
MRTQLSPEKEQERLTNREQLLQNHRSIPVVLKNSAPIDRYRDS